MNIRIPFVFDNVLEEFSIFCELHDEVEVVTGFDDFVEMDEMRMAEFLENQQLPSHSLQVPCVLDFTLLKNLHCHRLLCWQMHSNLHFPKCPFS